MTGYNSFAITIRPLGGITDKTISALLKWFGNLDYAFVCTEKSGAERHIHAQIWTEAKKHKGDVIKAVERICIRTITDWDQKQKMVLRDGICIAYSDWYLDYCADNSEKIDEQFDGLYSRLPDDTYPYYPSDEEQEKTMTMAHAVDKRFTDLEYQCKDYLQTKCLSLTTKNVALFLLDAMFNTRTIRVLIHQRDRCALATTLYAFMAHSDNTELFINKTAEEKKIDKKFEELKSRLENFTISDDESEN